MTFLSLHPLSAAVFYCQLNKCLSHRHNLYNAFFVILLSKSSFTWIKRKEQPGYYSAVSCCFEQNHEVFLLTCQTKHVVTFFTIHDVSEQSSRTLSLNNLNACESETKWALHHGKNVSGEIWLICIQNVKMSERWKYICQSNAAVILFFLWHW